MRSIKASYDLLRIAKEPRPGQAGNAGCAAASGGPAEAASKALASIKIVGNSEESIVNHRNS